LQTIGSPSLAICTKSKDNSLALLKASSKERIPTCSPWMPIRRTLLALISSLIGNLFAALSEFLLIAISFSFINSFL